MSLLLASVLASLPCTARGHSVSLESAAGLTRPSASDPRGGSFSGAVRGEWELTEDWTLHGGLGLARLLPARVPEEETFSKGGGWSTTLSLGADGLVGNHWLLGADAFLSPPSRQRSGTELLLTGARGGELAVSAQLEDLSRAWGASAFGAYVSAGLSPVEHSLDLTLSTAVFSTRQRITALRNLRGQTVTAEQLASYCATSERGCPGALGLALEEGRAELRQVSAMLGYTATLLQDTDIGLSGTAFAYSRPPAEAGYFTLVSSTRGASATFGEGLSLAPLRWLVRPSLAHRLGPWRISGSAEAGRLADSAERWLSARLRATWRISRAWRVWGSTQASRLGEAEGSASQTLGLTLGLQSTF